MTEIQDKKRCLRLLSIYSLPEYNPASGGSITEGVKLEGCGYALALLLYIQRRNGLGTGKDVSWCGIRLDASYFMAKVCCQPAVITDQLVADPICVG